MVIIPLPKRHQGSRDRGSMASQTNQLKNEPKMKNQWRIPGLVHISLYTLLHLCKQNNSDIIWWCHDCLLLHLGGKSLCTCTVESCWLTCTSANVPNLFPFTSHAWTAMWIPYPDFYTCDIYILIIWHFRLMAQRKRCRSSTSSSSKDSASSTRRWCRVKARQATRGPCCHQFSSFCKYSKHVCSDPKDWI